MLTQYLLNNNDTIFNMEYALYELDQTNIACKNHCLTNIKLFYHYFNYSKFQDWKCTEL